MRGRASSEASRLVQEAGIARWRPSGSSTRSRSWPSAARRRLNTVSSQPSKGWPRRTTRARSGVDCGNGLVCCLPAGKGVAYQPGASVAWRVATHVVKRTQRAVKRTLSSLEIVNADAFVFQRAGAAPEAPLQARRNGSAGVQDRSQSRRMARQGTWEALYGPRIMAGIRTTGRKQWSGPAPSVCGGTGAKQQARRGTGWRINKPKGRRAGSRSACIVLLTAGNRGRRDPCEGRRASHAQGHGGETGRKPEFRMSRKRNRHG